MQKISKDIPFYPDPIYRFPPKPVKIPMPDIPRNRDINPEVNIDFKENSPLQEGVISERHQRPDNSCFQEPQELESLINTGRLVQKFLPKKADINKILKVIQRKVTQRKRKVLKGTHLLPVAVKEIQAGYLVSPYLKDIYLYLSVPIQKIEMLSGKYILLDSLLFKIVTSPEKEMALLATPEVCTDKIITLYHSSLFAGHQGVIKHILQ